MKSKSATYKTWITALIGVATAVVAIVMWYHGKIDFIWDACLALSLSSALIIAPRTVNKILTAIVDKLTGSTPKPNP